MSNKVTVTSDQAELPPIPEEAAQQEPKLIRAAREVTQGEFWDRLSINVIRNIELEQGEAVNFPLDKNTLSILAINKVLWDLENEIRIGHDNNLPAEGIAFRSKMIVFFNSLRHSMKKRINEEANQPVEEKRYYRKG
jgi:hypothetical protein